MSFLDNISDTFSSFFNQEPPQQTFELLPFSEVQQMTVPENLSSLQARFFLDEKSDDFIDIPEDIVSLIFWKVVGIGDRRSSTLISLTLVNRAFSQLTPQPIHELMKALKNIQPFGKDEWEEHIGEIGDAPFIPQEILGDLQKPCPYIEGKRVYETHMLTLIPETVDGDPLTIRSVGELVKSPKSGNATQYSYFPSCSVLELYADKPVEKVHWALTTKNVIPGSMGKDYDDQVALVGVNESYEVPMALDMITSIFMNYVRSGECLVGWENIITRCQEYYSGNGLDNQITVGGFDSGGLTVNDYYSKSTCSPYCGVAVQRKFS